MDEKSLYPRPCACCTVPCILINKHRYHYHTQRSKKALKDKGMTSLSKKQKADPNDRSVEEIMSLPKKPKSYPIDESVVSAENWLGMAVPILKQMKTDGVEDFRDQLRLLEVNISTFKYIFNIII